MLREVTDRRKDWLGELDSATEQGCAQDLASLPDARAEDEFVEFNRIVERQLAERLRRLADLDRRKVHEHEGHLSSACWLAATCGIGHGAAKADLRLARSLAQMPATTQALEAGGCSLQAAGLLAKAHRIDAGLFARDEAVLVRAARRHPIAELATAVQHWISLAEAARGEDPEARHQAIRRFHASPMLDGMVRLDGELTPEVGESLLCALDAVLDAEAHTGGEDPRTPAQRRHDALGILCRSFLERSDRPEVAGERPHLNVSVDLQALVDQTPGAELDHVGPVGPALVRMLGCDASVRRVVLGPGSEPLDVGRSSAVVPAGLRRAVIARDHDCAFPDCDRPQGWCDIHHVRHWTEGGPTSLQNLLLLCRRHHRLVHTGRFTVAMVQGRPEFRRRDGSVLEDRAPP